jgi:eukaryotic-like serine/threonine-protein kinase
MLWCKNKDAKQLAQQYLTSIIPKYRYMSNNILHLHYQIVKVLGLGRSGITYLAQDIDTIELPLYVVKEIQSTNHSESNPALIRAMFEAQGSIAYRVGHHPQVPSIVAKFEEDGHRYLVREYIDGELLSQELIPGAIWSQTQVFDFLIDLVGILCFIHGFNYIHQDINPHNIIRRHDDGRFNLIGFSAVKDLGNIDPNISANHPVNYNNSSYIPYEQEHNLPQFNSDIYAVGVIAIQALTGKFPIERDADSYEFKWRDDLKIDNRLIEMIDRMVRPDYRNRYQSGFEVLADLQSFALRQLPISKTNQFKPYLILAGAICTLLLGVGVIKLCSAINDKPQLLAPTVAATKAIAPTGYSGVGWQTYAEKVTNFQIKYPKNWERENTQNIFTGEHVIFTSPNQNLVDKYRENISIRVEKLTNANTTLANYSQAAIAEINKYDRDAKIIESSSIVLAKKPAKLVIYTGKDENLLLIKNLEIWTIDKGNVYVITYKAEPNRYYQFLETAMTMINSFELK